MTFTDSDTSTPPHVSGILINAVRIKNFRCLKALEVHLGVLTVLIGENNVGKTSFLEALHAAIGASPRQLTEDDIWTDDQEKIVPKDRTIIIDLKINPADSSGVIQKIFPEGSPWLELWGSGVVQDDDDNDLVVLRTKYAWNEDRSEYVTSRTFLKSWPSHIEEIDSATILDKVDTAKSTQVMPLALYLLDAKRDGVEDIRSGGSLWRKLVSEPDLSEDDVRSIEEKLSEINSEFIDGSKVLTHLQTQLALMGAVVNCDSKSVALAPVARRLKDLHKGIDITMSTIGASPFSLRKQGMGSRSLASILLFRAYMTWKHSSSRSEALHSFLALEEPEAHLHPQAQRSLYNEIASIPGQKIISTHSPYICAQADVRDFINFQKVGDCTITCSFHRPKDKNFKDLNEEEIRKINREVIHTRGDLLFSRVIILCSGETEEQALPVFLEVCNMKSCHELGIVVISVDGDSGYKPFIALAKRLNIPWIIFSDGEESAIANVNKGLKANGEGLIPNHRDVIVLPDKQNFEKYLIQDAYRNLIRDIIIEKGDPDFDLRSDEYKAARKAKVYDEDDDKLYNRLSGMKTIFGAHVAYKLATLPIANERTPKALKELIEILKTKIVDFKVKNNVT